MAARAACHAHVMANQRRNAYYKFLATKEP